MTSQPHTFPAWAQPLTSLASLATLTTAVVCGFMVGCGEPSQGTSAPSASTPADIAAGHQRMRDELRRISEWVMHDNRFLGDGELLTLQAELAERGDSATPRRRFRLHSQISAHQLRLGLTGEALASLDAAALALRGVEPPEHGRLEAMLKYYRGLAWLRFGENANCVTCRNGESCLAPIQEGGIHKDTTGSGESIAALTGFLEHPERDDSLALTARWLLNIAAMTLGQWPHDVPAPRRIDSENFLNGAPFTRFTNVSSAVGLDTLNLSGGAVLDDLDNDGLIDVLTSTWDYQGELQLFHNNNDGSFTERGHEAGLSGFFGGLNMIHADVDNDDDSDVLVLRGAWFDDLGMHPNSLLINDGKGSFHDATFAAGLGDKSYPTQGAAFADYDDDGDLDLDLYCAAYVEDMSEVAASWLGLDHEHESGRLLRNNGAGVFDDVTEAAGLERLVTTMGANVGDLDNDGWLHFYLGTGFPSYTAVIPNVMYRNVDGERFEDVTAAGGLGQLQKGHGLAFADIDNDGDQDVFEQMGGAYTGEAFRDTLYRNPGHGHHWLAIDLAGTTSNRDGFGARVSAEIVDDGTRRTVHRQLPKTGCFGSNPLTLHFGLGTAEQLERLTFYWPTSDTTQVFENVAVNRTVRITEGDEALRELPRVRFELPES
ncbi:MAG: hypothetical protein ACI9EF_000425 [Pseudohongiellaceae bacterium]|jgi:hypothetical protein